MYLPPIKHLNPAMPTKYWFKDWFDSEDYHKLYSHRNQEEAETFIQNLTTM